MPTFAVTVTIVLIVSALSLLADILLAADVNITYVTDVSLDHIAGMVQLQLKLKVLFCNKITTAAVERLAAMGQVSFIL